MSNYLVPEDDGLLMRESGSWVAEKLDYLKRYVYIFETSMYAQPWRRRNYIDLFSGPGKCFVQDTQVVYLGSPLLSLTTEHPFTDYFFVDLNPENIDALRKRISASPLEDHVWSEVGDANEKVLDVVEQILTADRVYLPGKRSCLNLAFLDPAGIDLHWNTITALARPYSMDLIIYYPQMGLERNMPKLYQTPETNKIDLFFGSTEWRKIFVEWRDKEVGLHRHLMDLYKSNLVKLGYKDAFRDDEVGDEPLIRNAGKNAPLYRLLFASKHPLGHDFWHKVMNRNVYGQGRLL
jgi:three-Cys-motif partner protein